MSPTLGAEREPAKDGAGKARGPGSTVSSLRKDRDFPSLPPERVPGRLAAAGDDPALFGEVSHEAHGPGGSP